jgi:hypothetical protein
MTLVRAVPARWTARVDRIDAARDELTRLPTVALGATALTRPRRRDATRREQAGGAARLLERCAMREAIVDAIGAVPGRRAARTTLVVVDRRAAWEGRKAADFAERAARVGRNHWRATRAAACRSGAGAGRSTCAAGARAADASSAGTRAADASSAGARAADARSAGARLITAGRLSAAAREPERKGCRRESEARHVRSINITPRVRLEPT